MQCLLWLFTLTHRHKPTNLQKWGFSSYQQYSLIKRRIFFWLLIRKTSIGKSKVINARSHQHCSRQLFVSLGRNKRSKLTVVWILVYHLLHLYLFNCICVKHVMINFESILRIGSKLAWSYQSFYLFPKSFCWRRNGNPLLYSCPENSMDRGAWWAAVHGVMKSWTLLMWL